MPDKILFKTGDLCITPKVKCIKLIGISALFLALSINYLTAQKKEPEYGFKFKNGQYFLLNQKGRKNKKVEPFTFAEPFSEGIALVEKDLKFGFINTDGDMVINYKFYNAGSFSSGLAYAQQGSNYGFINQQGDFVIPPQFEMVTDFEGEYAIVLKSNPDTTMYGSLKYIYGYINKQGELMADRYFSSISYNEKKNIFKASIKGSKFYISTKGEIIREEKKKPSTTPEFLIIENMPEYPGGTKGLKNYIKTHVRYPLSAQQRGIIGKIHVNFVVNSQGNVCHVYPFCKESAILLHEAVRVVKGLSQWNPGKQDGKAVSVNYTIPINFMLN